MNTDLFLKQLLNSFIILLVAFVSYNIGKQSTITKVISIIESEEQVTTETVLLEDIKIDVSKMR